MYAVKNTQALNVNPETLHRAEQISYVECTCQWSLVVRVHGVVGCIALTAPILDSWLALPTQAVECRSFHIRQSTMWYH